MSKLNILWSPRCRIAYMRELAEQNYESYKNKFSNCIKLGLKSVGMVSACKNVNAAIRADPMLKNENKENKPAKKS